MSLAVEENVLTSSAGPANKMVIRPGSAIATAKTTNMIVVNMIISPQRSRRFPGVPESKSCQNTVPADVMAITKWSIGEGGCPGRPHRRVSRAT
jgi:hypothetical protein